MSTSRLQLLESQLTGGLTASQQAPQQSPVTIIIDGKTYAEIIDYHPEKKVSIS